MPECLTRGVPPERAAIEYVVSYLKTCPEPNVKELIGRRLATGVFYGDADEVLYWATVHHTYLGKALDKDLHLEILGCLGRAPTCGH